ncbi:hypothetical protein [Haliangium sp.]|uniref:hypothetical protein n=1 Tax=Haliangium sp. TaxID=2663208 RepID=UPI003D11BD2C
MTDPADPNELSDLGDLGDLIQEHFDGVLHAIEVGRWGNWILEPGAGEGGPRLRHRSAGYTVRLGGREDWIARVAEKDWATVDDVGQLVFAIRDLEYARWLGLLPANAGQVPRLTPTPLPAAAGE